MLFTGLMETSITLLLSDETLYYEFHILTYPESAFFKISAGLSTVLNIAEKMIKSQVRYLLLFLHTVSILLSFLTACVSVYNLKY